MVSSHQRVGAKMRPAAKKDATRVTPQLPWSMFRSSSSWLVWIRHKIRARPTRVTIARHRGLADRRPVNRCRTVILSSLTRASSLPAFCGVWRCPWPIVNALHSENLLVLKRKCPNSLMSRCATCGVKAPHLGRYRDSAGGVNHHQFRVEPAAHSYVPLRAATPTRLGVIGSSSAPETRGRTLPRAVPILLVRLEANRRGRSRAGNSREPKLVSALHNLLCEPEALIPRWPRTAACCLLRRCLHSRCLLSS